MKNSKSFSVLFWTNKAKADNNGSVPLYARVTVAGKRAEISLKKKLNPKKWDAATGFMKGGGEEVRLINDVGNDLFSIYTALDRSNAYMSAEEIKKKYTGQASPILKKKTILETFDEHNRDVESLVGKDYVKATLTKYKTIRGKVQTFIKTQYGKDDLQLEVLDYTFISGLELYLKVTEGLEHNTTMS